LYTRSKRGVLISIQSCVKPAKEEEVQLFGKSSRRYYPNEWSHYWVRWENNNVIV